MAISDVWQERLRTLRDHGGSFSYTSAAEIIGISRTNARNKLIELGETYPGAVSEIVDPTDVRKKLITINYALLPLNEIRSDARPRFVSPVTFEKIKEIIGSVARFEVEAHTDWSKQFQRGGLTILTFERQEQRIPSTTVTLRFDNCILLTPEAEVSTICLDTKRIIR